MCTSDSIPKPNGGDTVNDTGQDSDRAELDSSKLVGGILLVVLVPVLVPIAVGHIAQLAARPGISWPLALVVGLLILVPIAAILEEM